MHGELMYWGNLVTALAYFIIAAQIVFFIINSKVSLFLACQMCFIVNKPLFNMAYPAAEAGFT